MRTRRLGAALLISAAVLAACGDGGDTTAPTEPVDASEMLEFEAATVAGSQLAGGDLAGQDLALWFWAPW